MAWDFETEPAFQRQLDWMRAFVVEQVEPLDALWPEKAFHPLDGQVRAVVDPLKAEVRRRDLWACNLGPELGGKGFGQLKLALMNEIIGRSQLWGPIVFGCQAPDTGNAEILAHYGTDEQKARYLQPLLDGEVFSCFSMTEPQGGSDPGAFVTRAVRDGDGWVLSGRKYFSSNARTAAFLIVMAVTDPDAPVGQRMSMFLVPADTPGVVIERNVALMGEPDEEGMHATIRYDEVHLPAESLLGRPGEAFRIAQTRLAGGRLHHAMRTVGQCQRAFDMMCERALSRESGGSALASRQAVQHSIADAYVALQQFRLHVLYAAWLTDTAGADAAREQVAAVKISTPKVQYQVVSRAIQVHGAIGVSADLPLGRMWMDVPTMGVVDGPTEVHKTTLARLALKKYQPSAKEWPSEYLPARRAQALATYEKAGLR